MIDVDARGTGRGSDRGLRSRSARFAWRLRSAEYVANGCTDRQYRHTVVRTTRRDIDRVRSPDGSWMLPEHATELGSTSRCTDGAGRRRGETGVKLNKS